MSFLSRYYEFEFESTTGSGYVLVDIFLLGGILHFFHSMGPRDQEKFGCQLGKW